MRCLSLWQPWASAIALGAKTIETRGWSTSYRGPVAIHAAQRWTSDERAHWTAWRLTWPDRFPASFVPPLGAVVAVAELADCVRAEDLSPGALDAQLGNFAPGRFGWLLTSVRPLERPLPLRGRQGLWGLTDAEAEQVLALAGAGVGR